jgi:signal transduction histidine kinase
VSVDREQARAAAKVSKLESLAAEMSTARPLEAVVDLVIDQISDVVNSDAMAVWLYDADNDLWYIAGSRGLGWRASRVRFRGSRALHSRVEPEGEIISDLDDAGFHRPYPEHLDIHAALYAPISISGKRVGLLAVYRKRRQPFGEDDLSFARTVGAHVGMAVSFAALEARSERLAVMEERARLGADLHDGVLQILSSVRLYGRELRRELDDARAELDPGRREAIDQLLGELLRCVDSGSEEIAGAVERLRRPDFTLDIARSLELARERLQNAGIATELVYELGDVTPEVSDALAWISREAASNILRHSRARNVVLELRATGPLAELVVSDDGARAPAEANGQHADGEAHLGRHIMRERAEQLGGTCTIESGRGGTRVRARIPRDPTAVPVER